MALNYQGIVQSTTVAPIKTTLSVKDLIAKILAYRNITTTTKTTAATSTKPLSTTTTKVPTTSTSTTSSYEVLTGLLNSVKNLLESWLLSPPVVVCCENCQSTTTTLPSTTTKTTTPPPICGTLIDLNLSIPQNHPATNGFEAGIYYDGSIIYTGAGDFTVCWGINPGPARIMTNNNIAGPGGYSSCTGGMIGQIIGESFDFLSPQYFYNHADLKWILATTSTASSVPGAIVVGNFFVGLIDLNIGNGTFQQIGRIQAGIMKYYIPGTNIESSLNGDVFVLACGECTNGGSGVYCCNNTATSMAKKSLLITF